MLCCSLTLSNERTIHEPYGSAGFTSLRRFGCERMLFQVHLWSGIALGLYVLLMSTTGSVLVYSNELYRAATPRAYLLERPRTAIDRRPAFRGRPATLPRLCDQ